MAEGVGFEPTKRVNVCLVSSEVISASHPSFQVFVINGGTAVQHTAGFNHLTILPQVTM
tara:strand:+ start:4281 stop:4457 length:177 start_codon:yes stop_codon:yes gene_type:complete